MVVRDWGERRTESHCLMGTVNNTTNTSILQNEKCSGDRGMGVMAVQQCDLIPLNCAPRNG